MTLSHTRTSLGRGDFGQMTGKADFTAEEWDLVLEGPPAAGTMVVMADRGGTFRETFSMGKAYTEARRQHGESELLDEVVSTKPKVERTRPANYEELKEHALAKLREAAALLERKATPEELDDYRKFVVGLAERVAAAHKEGGESVSGPERAAIDEIGSALGVNDSADDQEGP
jgi:predicted house-cleaning noncanonical NTP pyrophosphatase (MazG superfamily)